MLVWAHRGASAYAPENTLEAFKLAADMGADGVELDVHICKSGEVVVCHDETIDRTSTGNGKICEMTLDELRQYSFHNNMEEYIGAKIPTLKEVYELLGPTGLTVNVELKTDSIWYDGIEEKCIAIAAECGMTEKIIYSSFNHRSLAKLLTLKPDAYTGLLYSRAMEGVEDDSVYAVEHKATAVHPYFKHCHRENYMQSMNEKGILVNPWTINDEEEMKAQFALGVNGLITNTPDIALKVAGR